MSDKLFNLMEKMYIEFSQFRGEMTDFKHDTNQSLMKIDIKLENEVLEKIRALCDDRAEVKESWADIKMKIDNQAIKLENHEVRIRVLEGCKRNKTV